MTHVPHARIQSVDLHGPAGRLEALLNFGAEGARYAAVVTHPHPLFGGTMHNKVVFHAMKALNGFGFPVLRFNFRGTGTSEGVHDNGRGEVDDVRAAMEYMKDEFRRPLIFAGFSFGAAVGLQAACPDLDVKAVISIGTPVQADNRVYQYNFLRQCDKPKLFISGDHDQFARPEELAELVERVSEPKELVLIRGGDHFFSGHLEEYRQAMEGWVRETVRLE
ncbi:MAG TPA: alpha/beta fold hydrolase [Terriglobales bacterium]|nr:alpha/beta fold hydrolase [Terriglobales bacterium]